jgi:ribonuclease D
MRFIDNGRDLVELGLTLSGARELFLDTEFESNRSGTELCLLQVSRGAEAFLVDAIALSDLTPLGAAFASAGTWVLHAGLQDVELICDRLAIRERPRIFDTQIAWAMLTVEHSVSLAYAQYRTLGVRGKKTHQQDDWVRRPLSDSQLAYAAADIEHLPALYTELERRAQALGRSEWIAEASVEALGADSALPQPLALDSFRNAWQLDPQGQAALSFLVEWFNGLSPEERRAAPEPKTLLALASRLPHSVDELLRIKGVPRGLAGYLGKSLLAGLARATSAAAFPNFAPIEPPPYATVEEIRIDGWLAAARAHIATSLAVAPELALPARIVKGMKAHALAEKSRDFAHTLSGFRRALLTRPLAEFALHYPLEL